MKKNYETAAVKALVEKLKKGVVTFYMQCYTPDDWFEERPYRCQVRGTLIPYEDDFGKPYFHRPANCYLLFWDVELEEWRTIRIKNLITGEEGE